MSMQFCGNIKIGEEDSEILAFIELDANCLRIISNEDSITCNVVGKNEYGLKLKLPLQKFRNHVINGNFNIEIAEENSKELICQKAVGYQIFSMQTGYDGFYDTKNERIELFGKIENERNEFFDIELIKQQ